MTTDEWRADFSWVTETLAVGGSFPRFAAGELAWTHGIGAVVDLREEACDDVRALRAAGIAFLHLPTRDHYPIEPPKLERGVSFLQKATRGGSRALIHCERGVGRSATLALCVMVAEGWRPLDALKHVKDQRTLVSPSPAQYRCWIEWLGRWKARHGTDWMIPDFVSFGSVAYRPLSPRA